MHRLCILYRYRHHDSKHEKARLAVVGLFRVWNKVKMQVKVKGNRLKEEN